MVRPWCLMLIPRVRSILPGPRADAEANDMVVLYPQASGSPLSGEGCWNWEAFADDPNFDTKSGVQLGMVMSIAADLDKARHQSFMHEI